MMTMVDDETIVQEIYSLSVSCLTTANFDLTLRDIIDSKNVVIDLWTTRCTRCPDALDTLNEFANARTTIGDDRQTIDHSKIHCLSICCGDTLDGAREILDSPKIPRWNAIRHYFMEFHDKERLKRLLQFRQVPYYIAFDRSGKLVYSGNEKVDWCQMFHDNELRRDDASISDVYLDYSMPETNNHKHTEIISPTSSMIPPTSTTTAPDNEAFNVLVIDDMDF